MNYCYQCKKCIIDYDYPPDEKDCWCIECIKETNYKDKSCPRFEWNKSVKRANPKDHPEYKFDEQYNKYINQYFRYKDEPEVIYQLLKCFDSFVVYKVDSPKYCTPRYFIYNKLFSIPEDKKLETSFDNIEWSNYEGLDTK